jgi:polysaccharide pyruvyl transferase WcaK-like protein
MKILLSGDHRDVPNWGCRATSISLSQFLSREHIISSVIDKRTLDTPKPIGLSVLDRKRTREIHKKILKLSKKRKFVQEILNVQPDFISQNPEESMTNLLKNKDQNWFLKSIYEKVCDADIVVINGEGGMIFTTPTRRDLLFQLMLIRLTADYFKKPVFFVNAMVSDCPFYGRDDEIATESIYTLGKCNDVTLRDFESVQMVKSIDENVNCSFLPDMLFSWFNMLRDSEAQLPPNGDFIIPFPEKNSSFGKFFFHEPYLCIGGSSLAAWDPEKATPAYCALVNRLKDLGMNIYLVETCSGDRFLHDVSASTDVPIIPVRIPVLLGGAILANARLLISGRYHPSIMASLNGTPCIFLKSNSHKTRSLQNVLEYNNVIEFPVNPDRNDCEQIYSVAREKIERGEKLRKQIKSVAEKRSKETERFFKIINTDSSNRLIH